jgi:hypothetical protein
LRVDLAIRFIIVVAIEGTLVFSYVCRGITSGQVEEVTATARTTATANANAGVLRFAQNDDGKDRAVGR